MIDDLGNHRARGPAHGGWHTLIHASDRLGQDKTLLCVSKKNHHVRRKREACQWSVNYVRDRILDHREGGDLAGAHVIEVVHRRKRLAELCSVIACWFREMMGVDADCAHRMIL